MNPDAFESSETAERQNATYGPVDRTAVLAVFGDGETVDRTPSGNTAADVRRILAADPRPSAAANIRAIDKQERADLAVAQDMRLKRCGLVWHEDQLDSRRWVSRPGTVAGSGRVKVLPLTMVDPTPGLEITALDGEKYFIPRDFKGDWFAVRSPKGVDLIP